MIFYVAINRPPPSSGEEPFFSELVLNQMQTPHAVARSIFNEEIPYPHKIWLVATDSKTVVEKTGEIAEIVRDMYYEYGVMPKPELDQWLYSNDAQFIHEEDRNENV